MDNLTKLKLKLGIDTTDASQDDRLEMCIEDATTKVSVYLNMDAEKLEDRFTPIVLDIAVSMYHQNFTLADATLLKSESHSEGALSESYTYKTSAEYDNDIQLLLQSIARYRRVYGKRKTETQNNP